MILTTGPARKSAYGILTVIYVTSLAQATIGKTPVRIILWCPTTKMLIKACFLIQPLEQEGGC